MALVAVAIIVVAAAAFFSMTPMINPGGPAAGISTSSSTETTQTPTSTTGSSRSTAQSSCTVHASGGGNITVTVTAGQFPPCGCALVDSNSNGSLYVSTNSKVGDIVCITAALNNSPQVYLSITNSAGGVVFSGSCVASQLPGAPSPKGDTCAAYWDTSKPDLQGNPIEPGTYHLIASDYEGSPVVLETNFTLS